MPAKSKAQQRLMGAAEHGATFPLAQKIRSSMTHQQMHDFASGSEKGKPERVSGLFGHRAAAEPERNDNRRVKGLGAARAQLRRKGR